MRIQYSPKIMHAQELTNKGDSAFICFDVVEFYPSITEALLNRALDFASEHVNISADKRLTIINSKHSLLFKQRPPMGIEKFKFKF